MIINRPGAVFLYNGVEYHIGDEIIGTSESEYEGLLGSISEIRTGADKETENEGPDFYCSFNPPVWPTDIKRLEDVFSDLYGEPKKIEDIILDLVIMAPSMVRPINGGDYKLTVYTLEMDWAANDECGHEVRIFSCEPEARAYLNKLLEEEMDDGCIPGWRDDEDFREDTDGNSYECWLEGFYDSNHYALSIKKHEIVLDGSALGNIGRIYISQSQREDFISQIEQSDEVDVLTDEQCEKMKADPSIPGRIDSALGKSDTYWECYWDAVNLVIRDLVSEYETSDDEEGAE